MRSRFVVGTVVGLLTAAVAVGVGEAAAAFVRPAASPVYAVGNRLITLTPGGVERAATGSVGTNDKPLLLLGIYVLLAAFGAVLGQLALARLRYGLIGVAALGVFGGYCALTARGSQASDVIPTIVGAAVAAGVMTMLVRIVRAEDNEARYRLPALTERRSFLQGAAAAAGLAALAGFGGRSVQKSNTGTDRASVSLPAPVNSEPPNPTDLSLAPTSGQNETTGQTPAGPASTEPSGEQSTEQSTEPSSESADPSPSATASSPTEAPAPPPSAKMDLGVGAASWATTSADFYRIDTALQVPQLDSTSWSLRIHGMVDREITLNYSQLRSLPLIERWVTLCCVSNPVGGPLVSNAQWLGARLADVLRQAGVQSGADQLLMTSVDGYTFGAPVKVVMDGRDAMLAIGMNGQPLPTEHGFPVRVVVPGLYGYVSACKWVVDMELTTFDKAQAYWVQNGWDRGDVVTSVKLESRIDTPRSGATVLAGVPVPIAGVAWDQHVGVSRVEIQVDDGSWLPAQLAAVPSTDTWRQWVVRWTPPKAGSYRVRVRAVDGKGQVQTSRAQGVFPSGATGLHAITVKAR